MRERLDGSNDAHTMCHCSGIVQDFFDPNDKVQKHRPAFRYVEPWV